MQMPRHYPSGCATVAEVTATAELALRRPRAADPQSEAEALRRVTAAVASGSTSAYQTIVTETALALRRAVSAGITLKGVRGGATIAHWAAVVGPLAEQALGAVSSEFVPCGTVLASGSTTLMRDPARHFTILNAVVPSIRENLIVPVRVDGATVGTLWICTHEGGVHFDLEDGRLLESLANFVAIVYRQQQGRPQGGSDASQRTLDAVMDYLPEGITIAEGPDAMITRVSRYGQELTGRPLQQLIGIAPPQHADRWDIHYADGTRVPRERLPLTRAVSTGEVTRNEELQLRRADGTIVTILCNAGPIRAPDGSITGGLVAWRDIDDFKRTNEHAAQSQRRLDAVLNNTTAAIFLMDDCQHCVYMNAAAERLTGYALPEVQGRPLHDVIHHTRPDGRHFPLEECPIDPAFPQNMREQGEETFVHKDGTFYPVAFTASPIRDVARTVGTVIEVRDLRPERAAEARLRFALRAAQAGVWSWDLRTGALDWSPEIFHLHGLPVAHRAPDFSDWERSVAWKDRERLRLYIEALLAGHERELRVEFRVDTPLGERWLLAVGDVERDTEGRAVRLAGLNLDVTHEKRTAFALASSEQALREAGRRKDEFLATLAHELRNPLAPVRNAVRVLANSATTPAQQQWSRDVIERQVGTMARLLDDLLDAARITSGKLELRRESVLIRTVLGHAVETSRPLIEARHHTLNIVLPDEPVRIEADPVRISQIIVNLLNNAAKYTPPGGRIDLVATAEAAEIRIEVRDTGVGLSPEALPQVFDLFAQVEEGRAHGDGGLGIGLALAKGLVELHGGRVEAHSEGLGNGASFVVVLPAMTMGSAGTGRATASGGSGEVERTVRHVLIADDNRDSADSLAMLLALDGHRVRVAYSGEQALEIAKDFEPEIGLLDIGMPGLNGYEVAQRIRAMPTARRITLVAITGWGQDTDKRAATAAGFDGHLTKPVDPDAIAALLRGVTD